MKKKLIPALILLITVIIATFYLYQHNNSSLLGEVEASILPHTAEVSGKIIEMPVALGQNVKKGDVIAKIDNTDASYALAQLEINLEKAKLNLSDASISNDSKINRSESNIAIAAANYSSAKATAEKASQDFQEALTLFEEGAIAREELDTKKLAAEAAGYAVTATKGQLDRAKSTVEASSITLQIKELENKITQSKENLQKFTVYASQDGIIMSKNYVVGDMVSPGLNLADLAQYEEKYLVFYLPKDLLDQVSYNDAITVAYKGKSYTGKVIYIDVKSEYTPEDLQTDANKNRESVKIKLKLPAKMKIKIGELVEIPLPIV